MPKQPNMATVDESIWMMEGAKKRAEIQSMFAEIAPAYDRINSLMSLRLHHQWRRFAVSLLSLNKGDRALDVCCGTGDFMIPLRNAVGPIGTVVGIDFCDSMLKLAVIKTGERLSIADAGHLPIGSAGFDAVTTGWGIRNVADIDAVHLEIARVLKPGGRFVSLEMARPKNRFVRFFSEIACHSVVPRIGALFGNKTAYTYLPKSTQRFWTREELTASMERGGFVDVRHKDLLLGNICVHYGKKPEGLPS